MDMKKYYQQLIGATITSFEFNNDGDGLDPFPCYTVQDKEGNILNIEISRDEEGNGGGFLFIAPAKGGGA
jgi:hypothetical protein